MRAAEFLDAPTGPAPGSAAAFLDEAEGRSASAFLDGARAEQEPTAEELERASRPATGIRTRGGQVLFTEPEPYRDNWDREVQGEQRAPWTGENGMTNAPAGMVASTRYAIANLRRAMAEEAAAQRRSVIGGPAVAETPSGAVTGLAAPGSIGRQRDLLGQDEAAITATERNAALARGDLQRVTPHGMNLTQEAIWSLVQSAPPTALGLAVGVLTRNPAAAMAIAGGGGGAMQAGSTYGEARDEHGATHRTAAVAATLDGLIEAGLGALPVGVALRPGSAVSTRILKTMAAEIGTESATQLLQDLRARGMENPNMTTAEMIHGLKVAALAGGMGGAVYGGIGAAATRRRDPITLIDEARTVDEAIAAADIAATAPIADDVSRETAPSARTTGAAMASNVTRRAADFLDGALAGEAAPGIAAPGIPADGPSTISASDYLDADPHAPTPGTQVAPLSKRPFDMATDELQEAIERKQTSDTGLLVRALGEERAREFERLDRARNSMNPDRADQASREFDEKFGDLTPEQERLIYGIGDTDAQVDDLKALLAARADLTAEPLQEVGRVLTRGMLDATPAEMRDFMRTGKGSYRVQAAAARVQSAVNEFNRRGTTREQIDTAIGGAMSARGFSYHDALEVLSPFTQRQASARAGLPDQVSEARAASGDALLGQPERYAAPSPEFRAAVGRLMNERTGESSASLFNLEVGAIDLVWGSEGTAARKYDDGYGLAHILRKHPEIDPYALEGMIASARKTREKGNTVELETSDHRAVIKLDWEGQRKKWLLTAFELRSAGTGERIGVARPAESAPLADQEADRGRDATPGVQDGQTSAARYLDDPDVLGMPAGGNPAQVGYRSYAPVAGQPAQVQDPRRARPDAIREAVTRLLNVPIRERHLMKRNALGVYKVMPRTIRLRNQNDLDTLSHEVGHHFSETNKRVRVLQLKHQREMLALTPTAYAKEPLKLRLEEGFAEYVRLYLTQHAEAQRVAPKFTADFDAFVDGTQAYRPILDRIQGMVDDWFALSPAERIMAKVGRPERTIRERVAEVLDKDRLIFEVLDNWLPLRRMVEDLNPDITASHDPFKAAHLLSGDAAVIEDWIVRETAPFDYTRRSDPRNYGKPLREVIAPVGKDLREFGAYLIARRADELSQYGKENLFTPEEIKAGLTLETPAFKAAADEVYAYQDQLIDYALDGGLLPKDAAAQFRQYTSYIPFFRESDSDTDGKSGGTPFKRLRGGTGNLRDPISNIVQNTASIIHATNRNAVLVKAYELAKATPGGGRWIERVPLPTKAVQVATERIIAELKDQGITIDVAAAQNLATMQTFFQQQPKGDDRSQTIIARANGEPVALQINNKMLWQALQSFEPIDMGLIGKLFTIPSDLLRGGIVISPDFISRNFSRDTLSGFIQSKTGLLPVVGTIGGFKEIVTRSDAARLYRAFGGGYADLWKGESDQVRTILERMAKRGRFDPRTILTPKGVIDVLHRIGSVSEAGTRVAEFKHTMRPGDVDSLFDAAYNAREVSVDFGMHGHNRAVRILTRITPFLNPALQGFYKMGRTGSEQFFITLLRGSMLVAASVLLYLNNKDEEWYDDIEQWEKNVYWHLDVGLRDDQGKVIPLRLPKPFEWGAVFGSVPEALAEVAIEQNGKRFVERLGSILEDVFLLRAIPTALLVPAEQWANRNQFTGRTIVPEAKKGLDPALQYGPTTSLTAREIGAVADISPARLDHLVRGLLGTMGMYALMLSDEVVKLTRDYPEQPTRTWRQLPVVRAFVHDPDNPNSRHITEFYELLDKARRADATHRRMTDDKADAYLEKHRREIEMVDDANQVARDMAGIRRDNEEIRESQEFSGLDKMEMIRDNNAQMKLLTRRFLEEEEYRRRERAAR